MICIPAESILPENVEAWHILRSECVTSSDVAALFGLSPYVTPFEYWHRKKERQIDFSDQEVPEFVRWGKRMEKTIAEGVAEEKNWKIRHMPEFLINRELKLGSSFDYSIEEGDVENEKGVLEVKNVFGPRFKEGWVLEDGSIEAPPFIELQIQNELALSNRNYGYISALVSGNQLVLLKRERDDAVITRILEATAKFWKSIRENIPPAPDFRTDGDFIAKLYQQSDGNVLYAKEDHELYANVMTYKEASRIEKQAKETKDEAKAQILFRIGAAEIVIGNNFKISSKTVKGTNISYYRQDYRGFRVTAKEDKNAI